MYEQKTSKKIPLIHYFWLFIIASLIGTFYEETLHIIYYFFKHHKFDWSRRSGLFFTPLSPVYGFGAVMLLFLLGRKERPKWKIYLYASLLGGLGEYVMSLLQEWITGTTSWDYSEKFLNIQGRTTVIYMLYWGIAGLLLIIWLYPWIVKLIRRCSKKAFKVTTIIIASITLIDISISWSALARREMRHKEIEPFTVIGKFYDEHFTDEFVESRYPNMSESKK